MKRRAKPADARKALRWLLACDLTLRARRAIGARVAADMWHGLLDASATDMAMLVGYYREPEWLLEDGLSDALNFWAARAQEPGGDGELDA